MIGSGLKETGREIIRRALLLAAAATFALINSIGPSPRDGSADHGTHATGASATPWRLTVGIASLVTTSVAILAALRLATLILGPMADFRCASPVPWRIEIALFGAFAVGLLKHMAHRLRHADALDVLIYLSLF